MADEVIPPPVEKAPPENAARITFKNVVAPVDDEPVLDEEVAQEEGADTETPLDEAAAPEAPPPLEHGEKLRLAQLRKADASFDEDLIEKLLSDKAVSERAAGQAQYLYNKSPAFRKAYLTALKEDGGRLTAEEEAEIAVVEKKEEAPQYTEKQIRDWIDKTAEEMSTTHSAAAIFRWMQTQEEKWIHGPAKDKATKAEETRRANEQRAQRDAAMATAVRAEGDEAFKAFPKLFKADPRAPYGYVCTDKDVWNEIVDQGGVKSMKEATAKALKLLRRDIDPTKQTTTQRAAVSAPRTNNLAPTTPKQADPEPGNVRISFKTRTSPRRG